MNTFKEAFDNGHEMRDMAEAYMDAFRRNDFNVKAPRIKTKEERNRIAGQKRQQALDEGYQVVEYDY